MTTLQIWSRRRADGPLRRDRAALHGGDRCASLRGSLPIRHTLAEHGAAPALAAPRARRTSSTASARVTGNQAMQMVRAGLKAIYLSGWQVAADANTAGAMYPDQSLYPGEFRSRAGAQDQPHTAARRPDRDDGRAALGRDLVRADRRRRGGRLRRAAQRVRDHEGLHRGGRRRRALRGPARLGEEVRPHGRQSADPDRRAHPQPRRRAPRRRRDGRPDARHRPHRRGGGKAHHLRHRRARPRLRHPRRAHGGRLLSAAQRPRAGDRPRHRLRALLPISSGARPRSRTSTRRGASPRACTGRIPERCSPTIARRPSIGRRTSTTRRSQSSSASWPRWATSSSSSRSPASTS